MSRVFARTAAHKVACDGLRWVTGAGGAAEFQTSPWLAAAMAAQSGLLTDMDRVADALYARVGPGSATEARA